MNPVVETTTRKKSLKCAKKEIIKIFPSIINSEGDYKDQQSLHLVRCHLN